MRPAGALPIASVPDAVSIVLDLKTPGSGEVHRNLYENIAELRSKDQIKFVILDKADYDWARFKISEFDLNVRVEEVLFSPVYESLTPVRLAEWILEDGLEVRLQVQLHKLLWGDKPGV